MPRVLLEFLRKRAGKDATDKDVAYLGLKDPLFSEYPVELRSVAAACKVIYIVRDPRAVTLSYRENRWGLGVNVYCGAQRWLRQNQVLLEVHREFPGSSMLIRYEDLLADPSTWIPRALEFLNIPFHDAVMEHQNSKSYYPAEAENINAGRPLDASIAERWISALSPREVALINGVCTELMAFFGYQEMSSQRVIPGVAERRFYELQQSLVGEWQLQRRLREKRRDRARRRG